MRQKKVDKIRFRLPIPSESFDQHITIKNIKDTEGLLDSDIFYSIEFHPSEADLLHQEGEFQDPYIVCLRERLETDEEYLQRMRECEVINRRKEEQERELYLRLKAKYENNEG